MSKKQNYDYRTIVKTVICFDTIQQYHEISNINTKTKTTSKLVLEFT